MVDVSGDGNVTYQKDLEAMFLVPENNKLTSSRVTFVIGFVMEVGKSNVITEGWKSNLQVTGQSMLRGLEVNQAQEPQYVSRSAFITGYWTEHA